MPKRLKGRVQALPIFYGICMKYNVELYCNTTHRCVAQEHITADGYLAALVQAARLRRAQYPLCYVGKVEII